MRRNIVWVWDQRRSSVHSAVRKDTSDWEHSENIVFCLALKVGTKRNSVYSFGPETFLKTLCLVSPSTLSNNLSCKVHASEFEGLALRHVQCPNEQTTIKNWRLRHSLGNSAKSPSWGWSAMHRMKAMLCQNWLPSPNDLSSGAKFLRWSLSQILAVLLFVHLAWPMWGEVLLGWKFTPTRHRNIIGLRTCSFRVLLM